MNQHLQKIKDKYSLMKKRDKDFFLKIEKNKYKLRITFLEYWVIDYFENFRKIAKFFTINQMIG